MSDIFDTVTQEALNAMTWDEQNKLLWMITRSGIVKNVDWGNEIDMGVKNDVKEWCKTTGIEYNEELDGCQMMEKGRAEFMETRAPIIKDAMTWKVLGRCIELYKTTIVSEEEINKLLKKKKIRHSNFPSHISENIAKLAIYRKNKVMPNWDVKPGDLKVTICGKYLRLEVKGSMDLLGGGPSSFGPKEGWDILYFVDGSRFKENMYKVYEVELCNDSEIFKNIKMNKGKGETYAMHCKAGRRPRICFPDLKEQVGVHCKVIFDGHFDELNYDSN